MFREKLWVAEPVGAGLVLVSPIIDLRLRDPEALLIKLASGGGNPDIRLQFRIADGDDDFNDENAQDDILASSLTAWTASYCEELHSLIMPVAPQIQLVLTELTGALDDTLVTASLWCKEVS